MFQVVLLVLCGCYGAMRLLTSSRKQLPLHLMLNDLKMRLAYVTSYVICSYILTPYRHQEPENRKASKLPPALGSGIACASRLYGLTEQAKERTWMCTSRVEFSG